MRWFFRNASIAEGKVAARIANNGPFYDDVQREANLEDEQLFELIYRAGPDPREAPFTR